MRAPKKQIGRWALESILPTIFLWVGIAQITNGYARLARDLGEAIFGIVCGIFAIYVAVFWIIARLEQRLNRPE